MPNKDNKDLLKRCIISLLKSSYSNIEIIIVENFSKEKETFLLYEELKNKDERIRIIEWKAPSFNYSLINNYAVEFAKGKIILFLNNDTEMINSDAIERMVENILRKEIGIIGAKLYYPDNTIQHGGVIFFPTGLPVHVYLKLPRDSFGEWGRLKIIQNYSAVTAACLMIRKEVFKEV
ncbi:MAG: glycosyltransferase [Chitinispirillaceae bacterium]|nr:glycosyltransferase [Chitinispirillaceae bacterium]